MKLSDRQRTTLKAISSAKPDHYIRRRGCTHPTLSSLELRGFVKLEFVPSKHVADHKTELWTITPEGRRAIEPM
jgi:hypothetical protein